MKVLFLDIDGVLNGHEYNPDAGSCLIKRDCIQRLNRILRETGAKIVVSSAWRYIMLTTEESPPAMTMVGFEYMLRTHGASSVDLMGMTGSDEEFGWSMENNVPVRGKQIRRWLADHRPHFEIDSYCVLDDDDLGISELHSECFVRTDGRVGLTDENADDVIAVLNS